MNSDNLSNEDTRDSCNSPNKSKSRLCKFGYVDYIVLASTISIALAEDFNSNDLSILATFFAVLADELALIGSIENCTSSNNSDTKNDIFPPPVPDVALTSTHTLRDIKTNQKKKRTVIKKIKRKNQKIK